MSKVLHLISAVIFLATVSPASAWSQAASEASLPASHQSESSEPSLRVAEPFFQPPAHQLVVDIAPSILTGAFYSKYGTTKSASDLLGFDVGYGLSRNFAISVGSDWGQSIYDYGSGENHKSSGLGDVAANVMSLIPLGSATDLLSLGLSYSFSPGPRKITSSAGSQNEELNRWSGSDTITPRFGVQLDGGGGFIWGLQASLSHQGPESYEYNGRAASADESSDSWAAALFGEIGIRDNRVGASLGQLRQSNVSGLAPSVYGVFHLSEMFDVVPTLTYLTELGGNTDGHSDIFNANVKARMAF